LELHSLHITIHACQVIALEYKQIITQEYITGKKVYHFDIDTPQFLDQSNKLYLLAVLKIQLISAQVTGSAILPLITNQLNEEITELISTVCESDICKFFFLVCAKDPLVKAIANKFHTSYLAEQ
jgi:hypothetical protein